MGFFSMVSFNAEQRVVTNKDAIKGDFITNMQAQLPTVGLSKSHLFAHQLL